MGCWPVHVPANCAQENLQYASFRRITWQLEKTLCCTLTPGQVVRVSSQTVAINCPLMKQLCFPSSCQMLSVRPRLQIASLCSLVSSSRSPSQLPITFCPRPWPSNVGVALQLGSRPGSRYWLFCTSPWDHSGPLTTSTQTQHLHPQWSKKYSDPLLK